MVTFSGVYNRFSRLAKVAAQKQQRKYNKLCAIASNILGNNKVCHIQCELSVHV